MFDAEVADVGEEEVVPVLLAVPVVDIDVPDGPFDDVVVPVAVASPEEVVETAAFAARRADESAAGALSTLIASPQLWAIPTASCSASAAELEVVGSAVLVKIQLAQVERASAFDWVQTQAKEAASSASVSPTEEQVLCGEGEVRVGGGRPGFGRKTWEGGRKMVSTLRNAGLRPSVSRCTHPPPPVPPDRVTSAFTYATTTRNVPNRTLKRRTAVRTNRREVRQQRPIPILAFEELSGPKSGQDWREGVSRVLIY